MTLDTSAAAKSITDTVFVQAGNRFNVTSRGDTSPRLDALPPGNYVIKQSPFGYYLELVASFPPIAKVYGDAGVKADRILSTFTSRDKNLGVLLEGLKGSGKTLLARLVSIKGYAAGIPTLVINSPFVGDDFFQFLYSIQQECIVFFDEFEKVYTKEDQEKLLTVLDGTYQSKKLFLMTGNDSAKIDTHLKNRPGRIHYYLNFRGLAEDFIREFIADTLINKDHADELLSLCGMFDTLNFDSLNAIIWEMNQYNERVGKAVSMLNTRPETDVAYFDAQLTLADFPGVVFQEETLCDSYIRANPLTFTRTPMVRLPVENSSFKALTGVDISSINHPDFHSALEEVKKNIEEVKAEAKAAKEPFEISSVDSYSYTARLKGGTQVPLFAIDALSNRSFSAKDLASIDMATRTFSYKNNNGDVLKLIRREVIAHDPLSGFSGYGA